ncbi:Ca(2+)-dependent cysteine protease [Mortierella alpina]|nr:Ca(2+)-dependent cysteine protease [Mortierella alpina]
MASISNDEIDPAILADVTRVVQELMRLQQEEQLLDRHGYAENHHAQQHHAPLDGLSAISRDFHGDGAFNHADRQDVDILSLSVQEPRNPQDPQQQQGWDQDGCSDSDDAGDRSADQPALLLSPSAPSTPSESHRSSAPLTPSSFSQAPSSQCSSSALISKSTPLQDTHNNLKDSSLLAPPANGAITNGSGPDQVLISLLPGQKTPTRAATSVKGPATNPDEPDHEYFDHGPASTSPAPATTNTKSANGASSAVIPRPILAPPSRPRRKKALLVGINYFGDPNQLLGCINDTRDVFGFLNGYYGFRYQDTIMLTDDQIYEDKRPTGANIRYWMKWLVKDADPQDSLFFHYAGHGGRIKDFSYNGKTEHLGDETDGYDEIIYPCDYLRSGIISDDEMYDLLVKDLPAGVQLTALVDACHSGTMLDLPYVYNGNHVTELEAVTRTKVGAMAAMSSGDFDLPSSDNLQTQTTTTTTTTTTTVTMTTNGGGASPNVSQFTNGSAKTTSGFLAPPGGVPPIHYKEGGSPLMTPGQSHSKRSISSEDGDIPELKLTGCDEGMEAVSSTDDDCVPQLAIADADDQHENRETQGLITVDSDMEAAADGSEDEQPSPRKRSKSVHAIVTNEESAAVDEVADRGIACDSAAWEEPASVDTTDAADSCKAESVQATTVEQLEEESGDDEGMKEARKLALFRETKGNVIMFSGCRDDQASADIRASAKDAAIIADHHKYGESSQPAIATTNWGAPTSNGVKEDEPVSNPLGYSLPQPYKSPMARGAVTYAWIQCLSQKRDQTYEELLKSMRYFMKQRDLEQIPQLGSGVPMDMRAVFVL